MANRTLKAKSSVRPVVPPPVRLRRYAIDWSNSPPVPFSEDQASASLLQVVALVSDTMDLQKLTVKTMP